MFILEFKPTFIRDVKLFRRKGGDHMRLQSIMESLRTGTALPTGTNDHQLRGKLSQYRELHVAHDWLLVYERDGKRLIITCLWLVSHKKLRQREKAV